MFYVYVCMHVCEDILIINYITNLLFKIYENKYFSTFWFCFVLLDVRLFIKGFLILFVSRLRVVFFFCFFVGLRDEFMYIFNTMIALHTMQEREREIERLNDDKA